MTNYHKYFHWYYHLKGKRALFNLGSGLVTGLVLLIAQPFGMNAPQSISTILMILGAIAAIAATTTLTFYFIDFLFIRILSIPLEKNHRIDLWGLVFKVLIAIHVSLIIRGFLCKWLCIHLYEYLHSYFAFFILIGLIYLIYSFYARSKYFLSMLPLGNSDDFALLLKGSGKETIKVHADALVYLKADDNYVDLITVEKNNTSQKQSIRATLSSLEAQLQSSSQFVRIHRSYMINTKFFSSLVKGKNEIELAFTNQTITLPVSRKYKPTITQLFTRHK